VHHARRSQQPGGHAGRLQLAGKGFAFIAQDVVAGGADHGGRQPGQGVGAAGRQAAACIRTFGAAQFLPVAGHGAAGQAKAFAEGLHAGVVLLRRNRRVEQQQAM
jgi:hypothetical protein